MELFCLKKVNMLLHKYYGPIIPPSHRCANYGAISSDCIDFAERQFNDFTRFSFQFNSFAFDDSL